MDTYLVTEADADPLYGGEVRVVCGASSEQAAIRAFICSEGLADDPHRSDDPADYEARPTEAIEAHEQSPEDMSEEEYDQLTGAAADGLARRLTEDRTTASAIAEAYVESLSVGERVQWARFDPQGRLDELDVNDA